MENRDEYQVEHDVDHACDGQKIQGALGITHGAEDSCAEVVDQHGHRTRKVDLHIDGGQRQDVFGRVHKTQERTRERHTYKGQYKAADQRGKNSGMYGLAYAVVVFCTRALGNGNTRAYAETDEHVDYQVGDSAGRTDRTNRNTAAESADHNKVGCVKKQLKQAGQYNRDTECYNVFEQRARKHIDLRSFHFVPPECLCILKQSSLLFCFPFFDHLCGYYHKSG